MIHSIFTRSRSLLIGLCLAMVFASGCASFLDKIEDALADAIAAAEKVGGVAGLLEDGAADFALEVTNTDSPIYGAKMHIPGGTVKIDDKTGPVIVTILPADAAADFAPAIASLPGFNPLLDIYGPQVDFALTYIEGNETEVLAVKIDQEVRLTLPFDADPRKHATRTDINELLGFENEFVVVRALDASLEALRFVEEDEEEDEELALSYEQRYEDEAHEAEDMRTVVSGWTDTLSVYAAARYNLRVCAADYLERWTEGSDTDEEKERVEQQYNAQGLLVAEKYFGQDDSGKLVGKGSESFEYDAVGRMTKAIEKDEDGKVIGQEVKTYDADGNLTSRNYSDVYTDCEEWDDNYDNCLKEVEVKHETKEEYRYFGIKSVRTLYENKRDGEVNSRETIKTDNDGNVLELKVEDEDGVSKVYTHTYANGKKTRTEEDQRRQTYNTVTEQYEDTPVDGKADSIHTFTYDAKGKKTRSAYDWNADGEEDTYTQYSYDTNGRLIETKEYYTVEGRDDVLSSKTIYTYHANHQRSTMVKEGYDHEGGVSSRYETRWNERGSQLYDVRDYDGDGVAEGKNIAEYDAENRQTLREEYHSVDGKEVLRSRDVYKYDENDNLLLESSEYDYGDGLEGYKTEYTYSVEGKMTGRKSYRDGELRSTTSVKYDANGFRSSSSTKHEGDGNRMSERTTTWDEFGRMLSEKDTDSGTEDGVKYEELEQEDFDYSCFTQ